MHHNINSEDIAIITEMIEYRQEKFPDESFLMNVGVVLMNYGDRQVQVHCINGEWRGVKADIQRRDGIPLCPNSHPLLETSNAPRLALVWEEDNNA